MDPLNHVVVNVAAAHAWAGNPRTSRSSEHILGIAASMKEHGQLQPIIVRYDMAQDRYEVIAGLTRLLAAPIAGLTELSAIVVEVNDAQALAIATAENTQRAGMTPLDQSDAFAKMIRDGGASIEATAAAFGVEIVTVRRALQLASLTEKARKALAADKLDLSFAMVLAALDPKPQDEWLSKILKGQPYIQDADHLRRLIFDTKFLVKAAIFDLKLYTGGYVEDLFADDETRAFAETGDAMLLQQAAAEARVEVLAKAKGHAFADLFMGTRAEFPAAYAESHRMDSKKAAKTAGFGVVVCLRPDGRVEEVQMCRRIADVKAEQAAQKAKKREVAKDEVAKTGKPAPDAMTEPLKEAIAIVQSAAIGHYALTSPRMVKVALIMGLAGVRARALSPHQAKTFEMDAPAKTLAEIEKSGGKVYNMAKLTTLTEGELDAVLCRVYAGSLAHARMTGEAKGLGEYFAVDTTFHCGAAAHLFSKMSAPMLEVEAARLEIDTSLIKTKKGLVEAITKKVGKTPYAPACVEFTSTPETKALKAA